MPDRAETALPGSAPVESTPDVAPTADWDAASSARGNGVMRLITENPRIVAAIALLACGIVFVMLGWYGAANTNIITEQIPYLISGGLLGLGLIIVSGILAANAMSEHKTDELRRDLLRTIGALPVGDVGARNGAGPSESARVLVLPDGHSFHLPGCPIIEGKDGIREMAPRQAMSTGLAACKLCGPE